MASWDCEAEVCGFSRNGRQWLGQRTLAFCTFEEPLIFFLSKGNGSTSQLRDGERDLHIVLSGSRAWTPTLSSPCFQFTLPWRPHPILRCLPYVLVHVPGWPWWIFAQCLASQDWLHFKCYLSSPGLPRIGTNGPYPKHLQCPCFEHPVPPT